MPYITTCKAPDIFDLGPSLLARTVDGLLEGSQPGNGGVTTRLFTGYILVTDKAIREYIAGRDLLIAYAASVNETRLLVEAVGRFENCINSITRAFRFHDRIVIYPEWPSVDRTVRRLLQSQSKRFTPIRNAIEHIDGDIIGDVNFPPEAAHLLAIKHDGEHLEIANHCLSLVDLANVLRNLHKAGCDLLTARRQVVEGTSVA